MTRRRSRSVLAGALLPLTVLGVLLVPVVPASAAGETYVALGDSYSSGTGTRSYVADGTDCLRSTRAYPSRVAARGGYVLNFRACSGAVIGDVSEVQLDALSSSTDLVTVSVGGNDAGFADVLTTCALPWWLGNCGRAVDNARSFIDGTLPGRLSALYAEIATRAPQADVVVAGYPRIFGGRDCSALTFFSSREMDRLNATADLINLRIGQVAASQGFAFADPTSRFIGHAVCASDEWINGLSFPIVESYHPDSHGHFYGYLPAVEGSLPAVLGRATGTARARVPAAEIVASQRRYAAVDASIQPQTVRVPDLTTPRARQAARRAGVDIDRWIERQQRAALVGVG